MLGIVSGQLGHKIACCVKKPRMQDVTAVDVFEAAAYALVAKRWRESYVHDARGRQQALQSAVELLLRAANSRGEQLAVSVKAAALARRAMAADEISLIDLLDQVAPQAQAPIALNLVEMLGELLRFMRNDAARKSIEFHLDSGPELFIFTQSKKLRMLLLGLSAVMIDELGNGSRVEFSAKKVELQVHLEIRSSMSWPSTGGAKLAWPPAAGPTYLTSSLFLLLSRQWLEENGGEIQTLTLGGPASVLRITYPAFTPD